MGSYSFISILIITAAIYLSSFLAVKAEVIPKATFIKVWNVILLLLSIPTILPGIVMAGLADFEISSKWYSLLLWYHVEFGISFSAIAILHIVNHLKYFKVLFRGKIKT